MKIDDMKHALKFGVILRLRTALLLRSGEEDEFADNTIEMTPDELGDEGKPKLHINGYVWSSLLRRALARLQNGQDMANAIGKYPKNDPKGVSPLWCDATYADLYNNTEINPGNKIDRKYGAASTGGLFSEEIVPQGHRVFLHFNYFFADPVEESTIRENILAALWVINEGIESIGGGWSYGHGRLEVQEIKHKTLDLNLPEHRKELWDFDSLKNAGIEDWEGKQKSYQNQKPDIKKPWIKYLVEAAIPQGQLLAIHTKIPPLDISGYGKLPDTFVFSRTIINEENESKQIPVITGKAFRQAIISSSIERKLRTKGEAVCLDTTQVTQIKKCPTIKKEGKPCKRCLWFGATDRGGIISVADAPVRESDKTDLNRIQLCEHTMQNMNLFSGEYLTQGQFKFEIIIDCSKSDFLGDKLIKELEWLLSEMKLPEKSDDRIAPLGWYRLGATSTCTGQIEVRKWEKEEFVGVRHG